MSPLRTASPAALASDSTFTHHCSDSRGSMGSPLRSECPTLCRYGRFSSTTRPSAASASRTATRASKRSIPSNLVPVSAIRPLVSMIDGIGSVCRIPISKSLGSWAGVTLTAPVPNSGIDVFVGDDDQLAVDERMRQRLYRPGADSARRRDAPRSRCRRASSRPGWWPPRCAVRHRRATRTGTTPARPRRRSRSPRGRRSRSPAPATSSPAARPGRSARRRRAA